MLIRYTEATNKGYFKYSTQIQCCIEPTYKTIYFYHTSHSKPQNLSNLPDSILSTQISINTVMDNVVLKKRNIIRKAIWKLKKQN